MFVASRGPVSVSFPLCHHPLYEYNFCNNDFLKACIFTGEKIGNVSSYKFLTHKEGCSLTSGAGKKVGRDILILIPFFPTACSAFIWSQMSWDIRQYDLTLHRTPQLTRPNSLPTMCFKIYMMASSSPQNTDAIPPKILHAVDLLPPFGVCEDSKILSNSQQVFPLVLSQREPGLDACNRVSLGRRNIILISFRM